VAEELQDTTSLDVQGLHRAKDRGLGIEHFTGPRDEHGRNTKGHAIRILNDVAGTGDIPNRVATSFEGCADTTGGEGGGIGFTLGKLLAGEFCDRTTLSIGFQEAVMLLSGQTGEGMEDVGVVSGAVLESPVLDGRCHDISGGGLERRTGLDRLLQRFVDGLGQPCLHDLVIEDILAKQSGGMAFLESQGIGDAKVIRGRNGAQTGGTNTHE